MKKSLCFLIILSLFLSACLFTPPASDETFGIYMLQNKNLDIYDDLGDEVLSKPLDSAAVLTAADIDFYDWSSHCIYLKNNKDQLKERLLDDSGFLFKNPGTAFVVSANGASQYYGYFHSLIMSLAPTTPTINEMSLSYYPDDVLPIATSWSADEQDTRNNTNVKQALIDAGLYHAGISVEIDTAFGLNFYPLAGDSSQMEYRFTISNHDEDALYVLDPDKIGTELFFYFNVAPSIYNLDTDAYLHPNHKHNVDLSMTPDTSNFDNLNWYTLLSSGESITRTVRTGNYTNVTAGRYELVLNYNTPTHTLSKKRRNKLLGRIWIGETQSPKHIINYTP